MLGSVRSPGFSETARSCPGHDKAGRSLNGLFTLSVFTGCNPDDVSKRPTERSEAGETDVETDVGHGSVRLAEHEHRAFDASSLEISMGRLSKRPLEGSDEVGLGNACDLRKIRDVERVRVRPVDGVSGAQHAAIQLFDSAPHRDVTVAVVLGLPAGKRAGLRLRSLPNRPRRRDRPRANLYDRRKAAGKSVLDLP
jgi:hypothetical protein